MPPVAPVALPWDAQVDDLVEAIANARAACGDTFVVESPGGPFLFLFSPVGSSLMRRNSASVAAE